MNEPENFLTRWSRRKTKAEDNAPAEKKSEQPLANDDAPGKDAPRQPEAAAEPAFDLSKLPSLDSITADTDIRAFWLPGVPESLRHAALRRAWLVDPVIRNIDQFCDYGWDFTTEGSMAGFGALDPKDIPRLMQKLLGPLESAEAGLQEPQQPIADSAIKGAQSANTSHLASGPADDAGAGDPRIAPEFRPQTQAESSLLLGNKALSQRSEETPTTAAQAERSSPRPAHGRRGHGRALPQ